MDMYGFFLIIVYWEIIKKNVYIIGKLESFMVIGLINVCLYVISISFEMVD